MSIFFWWALYIIGVIFLGPFELLTNFIWGGIKEIGDYLDYVWDNRPQ